MTDSLFRVGPHLLAELFMALDERDYERLIGFFVPNGTWQRQGQTLAGADQIRDALQNGRSPTLITLHSLTNVTMAMTSEREARSRFYLMVLRHDDGTLPQGPVPVPKPAVAGLCSAEFIATDNGWRIKALKTGPYAFAG